MFDGNLQVLFFAPPPNSHFYIANLKTFPFLMILTGRAASHQKIELYKIILEFDFRGVPLIKNKTI